MTLSKSEARALLGIGESADAEVVRRAYRRAARQHHPDAGGDAAAFHRLQEAVAVLLAAPAPVQPAPAASPSTTRLFRPSTEGRVGGVGWGESSRRRWHEGPVDVASVDWDVERPVAPHAWTRPDLVRCLATADAVTDDVEAAVVTPAVGQSRGPGSKLNRFGHVLASDLVSTWRVAPATRRGHAGHDVEVAIRLPSRRARRVAHGADLPAAWTTFRRPNHTLLSLVLAPSRDRRATAVRATDHLIEALDAMGWPLPQWYAPAPSEP